MDVVSMRWHGGKRVESQGLASGPKLSQEHAAQMIIRLD